MNIEIANRLYNLRKKHGYSQEELAEKIGVSRQAVSKWERSESSPDTDNLIALSKIYGVSIDTMLNEEADDYNPDGKDDESSFEPRESDDSVEYDGYEDERASYWAGLPVGIIATIVFFILGFAFNLWHPAWIVFLVVPVFSFLGKRKKRQEKGKKLHPWLSFPYPILATAIFLLIGFVWGGWTYAWLIFLTIPIWAFFASRKA